MTGIHVLNRSSEKIEGYYTNNSKKHVILNNVHTRNRDDHSETFDFTVQYSYVDDFENQNRIIIPDTTNGDYREFVIKHKETSEHEVFIQCDAAWLDDLARNSEPLPPINKINMTVHDAVVYALSITEYEVGDIEFAGFIDLKTEEYTRPYDLLLKIEELSGLQFDSTITTSGNKITGRYVHMRESDDLSEFTGKELVRGKDVVSIKHKVDTRELVTALLVTGKDAKDKSIVTKVYDPDARLRWGNNGKYSWDIINVDGVQTISSLESYGKKVLKNKINALVEYEVEAIEVNNQLGVQANFGDRIRVRDVTYTPHFYMEATVKSVQRDIFDDFSKTFTLGSIKRFSESDLRSYFNSIKSQLSTKLNDNVFNLNTIIEKNKIHTGTTPPDVVEDGKLWYDTNNPEAVVLREFKNGGWDNKTPDDAEKIGGIKKEKAIYSNYHEIYNQLTLEYDRIYNIVTNALANEYLTDTLAKDSLKNAFDNFKLSYSTMKAHDDALTVDNATMTELSQFLSAINDFRNKSKEINVQYNKANQSIIDKIKLLQSQYTEQKFTDAMTKVASTINGTYDSKTGQLTANIPTQAQINQVIIDLQKYANDKDATLVEAINKSVNAKIIDTKEEFTRQFSTIETSINNTSVGSRNLILQSDFSKGDISKWSTLYSKHVGTASIVQDELGRSVYKQGITTASTDSAAYSITLIPLAFTLDSAKEYTFTAYMKSDVTQTLNGIFLSQDATDGGVVRHMPVVGTSWQKVEFTSKIDAASGKKVNKIYLGLPRNNTANNLYIFNPMLVEGNKSTSYQPALEDTLDTIDNLTLRVSTTEGGISATQEKFKSYYSKTETNTLLDDKLSPVSTEAHNATSAINQLNDEINQKVSKSDYSADKDGIVDRLDTADSERRQLSNDISDRVTLTTYTSGIKDAKDYADAAVSNVTIGGRNLLIDSKNRKANPNNVGTGLSVQNSDKSWTVTPDAGKAISVYLPLIGAMSIPKFEINKSYVLGVDLTADRDCTVTKYISNTTYTSVPIALKAGIKQRVYVNLIGKDMTPSHLLFYTNIADAKLTYDNIKVEEATKPTAWSPAPEDITNAINGVQSNLNEYKDTVEGTFRDGVITESEAKAIQQQKLSLESQKANLDSQYTSVYNNVILNNTSQKTNLSSAKTSYDSAYTALMSSITTAIADGKATASESSAVSTNFTNYKTTLATLAQRLEEATDAISTGKVDNIIISGRNLLILNEAVENKVLIWSSGLLNPETGSLTSGFVSCNKNETYLSSISTSQLIYYDMNKSFLDIGGSNKSGGNKFTIHDDDRIKYFRVSYRSNILTGKTKNDLKIMLERATKPSEWQPAPEDIFSEIENSITNFANLSTEISKSFKDGILTDAEYVALKSNLNEIDKDKLDNTTNVNDLKANTFLSASLKTTLTTLKTSYDNAYTDLQTTITTIIADKKIDAAEKTTINTKMSAYNTALSNINTHIQQCMNDISDNQAKSRSSEAVNAMVIGTRNLIDSASIKTTATLVGTTKVLTHTGWSVQLLDKNWILNKLKPDTEYTMNYKVKLLSKPTYPTGSSVYGAIYLYSASTLNDVYFGNLSTTDYNAMKVGDVINVKNTFKTPSTFADDTTVLIYSGYHKDTSTGTIQYANMEFSDIMLVEGNKISSYQQAPEDITNEINQAINNFGNLSSEISKTFKDGIIQEAEAKALNTHLARIDQDYQDLSNIFTSLYNHPILNSTTEKTNLFNTKLAFNDAHKALRDTLVSYISDGKITASEKSTIDTLLNTYKGKVGELQSQFKICDDAIVQKTSQQAINNINVGGKNLIKLSDIPHSSSAYLVYRYELTEPWIVGQEYTISIKGNLAGGQFGIWRNTSSTKAADLTFDSKRGLWTATFICPASTMSGDNNITLSVYNTPSSQTAYSSVISQIQLEKGNVVTDWQPAPYDIDQRLITTETYIGQDGKNITSRATKEEFNKANQTLSKAITDFVMNAVDGATITHNVDGSISSATIGSNITLKSSAINLIGDVYMQDGKVRVSDLRIGGTDKNGKIEIKDKNDKVFFGLDTEQATASELSIGLLKVEKIENEDIVTQSSENMTFYVSGTGSNENDGLTLSTAFATAEMALSKIPMVYNGTCYIYLRELDSGERIEVKGFLGKGKIIFASCDTNGVAATVKVRSSASFVFSGNTIDCYVQKLLIEPDKGQHGITIDSSSVNASDVSINGSGDAFGVSVNRNSYFEWRAGKTTNVLRGVDCLTGSNAYLRDVDLYATDFGIVSAYASQVECNNVKAKANAVTSVFSGSFINTSGVTNLSTAATETVATPPVTKTVTLTSTSSGHYYVNYQGVGWGGTFMPTYPIQGVWSPYGERLGFWFFGSQFDQFNGKTIKKVRIYVGRSSVNMQGYTGTRNANIRMHSYASKPSSAPTTSSNSKVIGLAFGEFKWVDVTTEFASLIKLSSWKGFAVNTDSTSPYDYMAMHPTLKVEVTYA
ncbi:phage tail spike protein [Macrococcus capreoli]|uniref:phage tail spike protein n=1 Tax=Macrococcus capreoli TaxID=2982690 RepID=UPI0021D5C5E2|nr:phage tail spike protein [Macrococcus sp. TMW 2.2395]MCU7557250.1 hypothetical protein [Macrococcus sp. TMW 2.2395]